MENTENNTTLTEAKLKDDPVATAILELLQEISPGQTISPEQAARAYAGPNSRPNGWRCYLNAIRQQAIHLARTNRIEILRKGKSVDPNNFKGVYRLRLMVDDTK